MEIVRAVLLHNGRLQRVTEPTAPDHRAAGYLTMSCECYKILVVPPLQEVKVFIE